MSDYLQRLVSAAIRPTAGVHPVIAPLFSVQQGSTSEDLGEPVPPGISPRMSTNFENGRDLLRTNANEDAIPPNSWPVATAKASVSAENPSPPHATPSPAQATGEQWQRHAPTSGIPPAPAEAASTQSVYIPLLPETAGALPAADPQPAPPFAATSRAGRDVAERVRTSRSNKREPDEIQINIGRIEVTAVPEAPARPAPRPGRKQFSLDEYLRRADGRGR
jgi:hypothetical protein